jgi:hypothetical protein
VPFYHLRPDQDGDGTRRFGLLGSTRRSNGRKALWWHAKHLELCRMAQID